MNPSRTATLSIGLAAIAWLSSCSDDPVQVCSTCPPPPAVWPGIVSDPVSSGAGTSLAASAASDVVYVSLTPGSIPNGELAVITNRRTGSAVVAPMVAGGLDPVPVVAAAGDTLDIAVRLGGSDSTLAFIHVVVAARRPIVVRTDPPPKKRDVPLNAVMLVVFSEPIDPSTLTEASVQLRAGSTSVAGLVEVRDPQNLTAAFVPAAPLAARTDYQLLITQGIRDLDGDALEAPVTVEFTTEPPGGSPTQLAFTVQPTNTFAGTTIRPAIQVTAIDASGNTATSFTGSVSVAIGTNVGGGALTGTTTVGALAGVATFADLSINNSGTGYTLTATAAGLSGAASTAFDVMPLASLTGRIAFMGNGPNLYVMRADGSGVTKVGEVCCAARGKSAWSPGGSRLAFSNEVSEIVTVNPDGSGLANLTNHLADDYDPAWSPDGTRIAFVRWDSTVSPRPTSSDLYLMNADGSEVTRITFGPGVVGQHWDIQWPTWSPDGTRIAFERILIWFNEETQGWTTNGPEICIVNADGSGLTVLAGYKHRRPAWSPDGTRIAFGSYDDTGVGIWVMNADGSGATKLTSADDEDPAWTPDGGIVFARKIPIGPSSGLMRLYRMNADGSAVTMLNQPTWAGEAPAWSHP